MLKESNPQYADIAKLCDELPSDTIEAFRDLQEIFSNDSVPEFKPIADLMSQIDDLTVRESKILFQGFFHEYSVQEKKEFTESLSTFVRLSDANRIMSALVGEAAITVSTSKRLVRSRGVPLLYRFADTLIATPNSDIVKIGTTLRQLLLEFRHGRGVYHTVGIASLDGH